MERGHTNPYSYKQTILINNTGILRILERLLEQTNTSQTKRISFNDPSRAICPAFFWGLFAFHKRDLGNHNCPVACTCSRSRQENRP